MRLIVCLITFLYFTVLVEGYNVLFISTVPSPSHAQLARGFVKILMQKQHKVTCVNPFALKMKHENLTEININFIMSAIPADYLNVAQMINQGPRNELHEWMELMEITTRLGVLHDTIQQFINDRSQQFDLVVVDWLHSDVLMGFAALYQCPFVLLSSFDAHSGVLSLVDDVSNPAHSDHVMINHDKPFTMGQRLEMLWELLGNIRIVENLKPKCSETYEKAFGKAAASRRITLPSYDDLIYNASLVVLNSHPSFASSNRLPQNVKSVSGFYIEDPPPALPDDIKKIIEEAKHGVIYFSLGTNAKSKDIPAHIRQSLVTLFSRLEQTVLWKFEEELTDLPNNVIIRKWMPQASILAHLNVRIFITHGGMFSSTESVHYGVPVIGIPLFGDQYANMKRAVRNGNALQVIFTDHLVQDLSAAIDEMLTNSSYTRKARHISRLYHDRPQPAGEELLYWLEFVVRTGGAPHLRSPALLLPWYQRFYLDLLLVLLVGILLVLLLLWQLVENSTKKPRKYKKH